MNHLSLVVFASLYVRCAICEAPFDTDIVSDRAVGSQGERSSIVDNGYRQP